MLAVGWTCEIRVCIRVMRHGRLGTVTIDGADRLAAILPLASGRMSRSNSGPVTAWAPRLTVTRFRSRSNFRAADSYDDDSDDA